MKIFKEVKVETLYVSKVTSYCELELHTYTQLEHN